MNTTLETYVHIPSEHVMIRIDYELDLTSLNAMDNPDVVWVDGLTYSERKAVGFSLLSVIIMLSITLAEGSAVIWMEPEQYPEDQYQDFGPEALDTEPPSIPFTEEQYRYNAMISQTDFLPYMADRINNTPFTRAAKRSLTDFMAAFFNQSVILSHSNSVRQATLRFDLAMIEMKPSFAPSDVRLREYPGIMGALRAQFEFLVSRTVGGAKTRERVLQHGTVVTSRHEMMQVKPDAEKKEKLFGI